jgi:glycerol-3-phosphate dehydrogenase
MSDGSISRDSAWAALATGPFDVLAIGGGIVGAGVARDASLRGLRTLLVEQADFASGTSSRSSRLLHGGLRYLAQGRIGLVREASLEKLRLSRLAPHLCQPLPFIFPVRKNTHWPLWKLAIGVKVYDLLCGGNNLGRSSTFDTSSLLASVAGLEPAGLVGGVRYFDALTNDARLVNDTLRSSCDAGAVALNYAAFVTGSPSSAGWTCTLCGQLAGRETQVRARAVVNAAGAWAAMFPHSGVRLRLTKGVHLVIDRARLPVNDAVFLPEGDRIIIVIPWGERVILGTTDTDCGGDPGAVRANASDVDYILNAVNTGFPRARIRTEDLISVWAGVRPLIAPSTLKPSAPSDLSRSHRIHMTEPGWFDVAGGKLTTYRSMAEQTVDRISRWMGLRLPPGRTAELLIGGGSGSGVLPPKMEPAVVRECCRQEWAVPGGRPAAAYVLALLPRGSRASHRVMRRVDGRRTSLDPGDHGGRTETVFRDRGLRSAHKGYGWPEALRRLLARQA